MIRFLVDPDPDRVPLLFGFAPPTLANDEAKTRRITERRLERIAAMRIDGLVLYDVQDESDRTDADRPFAYLPPIDPLRYLRDYLQTPAIGDLPRIVYRAVARQTAPQLRAFLTALDPVMEAAVLVGAPSRDASMVTSLREAYALHRSATPDLPLGGVTIPERHAGKGDEHLRLAAKIDSGCTFFVTQCIYDAEAARNMLSDYIYHLRDAGVRPARVILTLSPCGSRQTISFMKWLGIRFPRWLENDLEHSHDILARSLDACSRIADELAIFCRERSIPFGFNVESVSIRRAEIEAAGELVGRLERYRDEPTP